MSTQNSSLKCLLSPSRSGTFFAPFRSRSANPDGFDSKMKLWINAIEEWAIGNKKFVFTLDNVQQTFISDSNSRPDKECIRLVFSEMKRRSRLVPLKTLKSSNIWSSDKNATVLDNFVDPNSWFGWSVKRFVYDPATWAVSSLTNTNDQNYSDLTDMSITDSMKFVSRKCLDELSNNLLMELVRISKAEHQFCFEWQHLIELISPIISTIIDTTDGKELLETLDIMMDYLAINKRIAIKDDNGTKLVKISNQEDPRDGNVTITQKDIAIARLLRAKELLTSDVDKYLAQAQRVKKDAMESYTRKEIAKAKSLLRSHKRLANCADQKDAQLRNVEDLLEKLENTDSNMMILQAYKEGAEALAKANSKIESNMSMLDDVYDATAEANQLNNDMNQMISDITQLSMPEVSMSELEAELDNLNGTNEIEVKDSEYEELNKILEDLKVSQDDPEEVIKRMEENVHLQNLSTTSSNKPKQALLE